MSPADNKRVELVDTDIGRWRITTMGSVHIVDLDHRAIRRYPGAGRRPFGFEHTRRLLQLVTCRVGEHAHYRAKPESPFDEYDWAISSVVRSIVRLPTR